MPPQTPKENAMAETTSRAKKEEDLVEFTLPLTYKKEIDDYPVFCALNFKSYLIKRGVPVKIPRALKESFEEAEKAKVKAYEYANANSADEAERKFKEHMNGAI